MKKTKGKDRGAEAGIDGAVNDKIFHEFMKNEGTQKAYQDEKFMFHLIESLKKEMAKQHITYYAIAKKAGLRHQVVAGVLNGSENVEIKTLLKVAQGLGKKLIVKFA